MEGNKWLVNDWNMKLLEITLHNFNTQWCVVVTMMMMRLTGTREHRVCSRPCRRRTFRWRVGPRWRQRWIGRGDRRWRCWKRFEERWSRNQIQPSALALDWLPALILKLKGGKKTFKELLTKLTLELNSGLCGWILNLGEWKLFTLSGLSTRRSLIDLSFWPVGVPLGKEHSEQVICVSHWDAIPILVYTKGLGLDLCKGGFMAKTQ